MRLRYHLLRVGLAAAFAVAAAPLWANTYSDPLWIAKPADDATIHNRTGKLDVSVALARPLDAAAGEYVQLLLDGHVVGDSSDSQHFRLQDVPLGNHTLRAQLRNRHDQALLRSPPVAVDMARAAQRTG